MSHTNTSDNFPPNPVRLYIDGEMAPADLERFEDAIARDPDLAAQVAFEQTLRERVAEVMADEASRAPKGLADRIRAAIETETEHAESDSAPVVGRIAPEAPAGRAGKTAWWDNPRRANAVAVAASLLLVCGAVLWGVFGRPIDQVPPRPSRVAEIALFASKEHGRFVTDPISRDRIAVARSVAEQRLSQQFGSPIRLPDLSALGYEFHGGCQTSVPGELNSCQVVFKTQAGALVSLFIMPDVGEIDDGAAGRMERGFWYPSDGGPECAHKILRCTNRNLVFFLVCCSERDLEPVSDVVIATIEGMAFAPTSAPG